MKRKEEIRRKRRNRAAMRCITLIFMLAVGILLWQGAALQKKLAGYREQERVLTEKIAQEEARTGEIDELKEYMQTDAFVEETARDRLGMVKDNEIVFREAQGE